MRLHDDRPLGLRRRKGPGERDRFVGGPAKIDIADARPRRRERVCELTRPQRLAIGAPASGKMCALSLFQRPVGADAKDFQKTLAQDLSPALRQRFAVGAATGKDMIDLFRVGACKGWRLSSSARLCVARWICLPGMRLPSADCR